MSNMVHVQMTRTNVKCQHFVQVTRLFRVKLSNMKLLQHSQQLRALTLDSLRRCLSDSEPHCSANIFRILLFQQQTLYFYLFYFFFCCIFSRLWKFFVCLNSYFSSEIVSGDEDSGVSTFPTRVLISVFSARVSIVLRIPFFVS